MRDTTFVDINNPNIIFNQQMFDLVDGTKRPKGIEQVLIERGKYKKGMKLDCKDCIDKIPHGQRSTDVLNSTSCCARYCLSQEPDFLAQKEWLTEEIERSGCSIIFYPKYHCELNYIEMVIYLVKCLITYLILL